MALKLKLKFTPELKAILARKPPANVRLKILLIKEHHLKRLEELSVKTAKKTAQLEEPTEEQEQWIKRRMRGNARSWEVWDQ